MLTCAAEVDIHSVVWGAPQAWTSPTPHILCTVRRCHTQLVEALRLSWSMKSVRKQGKKNQISNREKKRLATTYPKWFFWQKPRPWSTRGVRRANAQWRHTYCVSTSCQRCRGGGGRCSRPCDGTEHVVIILSSFSSLVSLSSGPSGKKSLEGEPRACLRDQKRWR